MSAPIVTGETTVRELEAILREAGVEFHSMLCADEGVALCSSAERFDAVGVVDRKVSLRFAPDLAAAINDALEKAGAR